MDRRLIPAFFAAIVIGSIFALSPAMALDTETRSSVPVGNSQALGPADAPVTFIEFVDYQ